MRVKTFLCGFCHHEVDLSGKIVKATATGYVTRNYIFCGLECFKKWVKLIKLACGADRWRPRIAYQRRDDERTGIHKASPPAQVA